MTPPGPFFTIETSACGTTLVLAEAVFFAPFKSFGDETVALSVTSPPFAGAVIDIVRAGKVPLLPITAIDEHMMIPPDGAPHVQPDPDPLAALTPAGSVLLTLVVPLVGSGPPFVIVIV